MNQFFKSSWKNWKHKIKSLNLTAPRLWVAFVPDARSDLHLKHIYEHCRLYHPQDLPRAPFIIIKTPGVTVGATSIADNSILNKGLAFLSLCCVSCFLQAWCHSAWWLHHIIEAEGHGRSHAWTSGEIRTMIPPTSVFLSMTSEWFMPISNDSCLVQAGVDQRREKDTGLVLQIFQPEQKNSGQVYEQTFLKCW